MSRTSGNGVASTSGDLSEERSLRGRFDGLREPGMALIALAVLAVALGRVAKDLLDGTLVSRYKLPLLWIDYRDGFVRRGLPGQILTLLTGPSPSWHQATLFAATLSLGAIALFLVLAQRLLQLVPPTYRASLFTLAVASPLGLVLLLRDVGRYDALVVAAVVAIALCARIRYRRVAVAVGSLALAVATLGEEFAVAFGAPLVVLAVHRWFADRRARGVAFLAMLGPAVVVAVAALTTAPDPGRLAARLQAAIAAGVGVPEVGKTDGVTALGLTSSSQRESFADYDPAVMIIVWLLLAGVALFVGWTVWRLVGAPAPRRLAATAAVLVLVVVGLSVVGVDFLRWWAMGFIAFLAALSLVADGAARGPGTRPVPTAVLLAAALLLVVVVDVPVSPAYIPVLRWAG